MQRDQTPTLDFYRIRAAVEIELLFQERRSSNERGQCNCQYRHQLREWLFAMNRQHILPLRICESCQCWFESEGKTATCSYPCFERRQPFGKLKMVA